MEKIFLSCLNFLINSLCFGSLVVHLNVCNHLEVPVFQMNIISIDLLRIILHTFMFPIYYFERTCWGGWQPIVICNC